MEDPPHYRQLTAGHFLIQIYNLGFDTPTASPLDQAGMNVKTPEP